MVTDFYAIGIGPRAYRITGSYETNYSRPTFLFFDSLHITIVTAALAANPSERALTLANTRDF